MMGRKKIQKRGRPPKWLKEQETDTTQTADELLNNNTNKENIMEKPEETTAEVLTDEESTAVNNSGENFDPFSEQVNEKDYQKAKYKVKGTIPNEVPEADIKEPSIEIGGNTKENVFTPTGESNTGSNPPTPPAQNLNENNFKPVNPIPKKDQQEGSRRLAEVIVKLYCLGKEKGLPYLFDLEGRLNKWIKKGKISKDVLRMEIEDNSGHKQKLIEFVRENNEKIKEICETSDSDYDEMVEAWYKVLVKRGIGLSDEWNLVYVMVKDLVLTGIALQSAVVAIKGVAETLNTQILELNKKLSAQALEIEELKRQAAETAANNQKAEKEQERKTTVHKGRPKKVKIEEPEQEEPEEKKLVEQDEDQNM